ncbi:MAG: NAD(P)H-dependent oxidoreductase [Spirochaetaceae bacterium]|nr:NAD(P)H-dependent oxidoreductase [Spirochaetaceae bacterium]
MKLTVFNGSPRGKSSNSTRMIPWIISSEGNNETAMEEICYLNKLSAHENYLKKAQSAEGFLFVFPLYVDSMPGITKSFFELMEKHKVIFSGKPVYFIIHSGFPEMIQSKTLSRYLGYFSSKVMAMDYKGTVIIGGSESLQMAPDGAYRKLQSHLKIVGNSIKNREMIPDNTNLLINKRDRLTAFQQFIFTINPLKNFYWNYRAKQQGIKIDLTDQPYA